MCKEKAKSAEEVACEGRPVRGTAVDRVIFKPDCIFCGVIRYKKVWHLGARISVNTINFERVNEMVVTSCSKLRNTKVIPN